MVRVLSLGMGVQSSTLAMLAGEGEFGEVPDYAVFADTQREPQSVYDWIEWLTPKIKFPVEIVTYGDLGADSLERRVSKRSGNKYLNNKLPVFTVSPTGSHGMMNRKCTVDYKIRVIQNFVRKRLDIRWKHDTLEVEMWMGISTDEIQRMKGSRVPWIVNKYPLIDAGMSRTDCHEWWAENDMPSPPRSACYFCPYHSDREWLRLKTEEPNEFRRAVEYERELQDGFEYSEVADSVPYLHSLRQPLDTIDFAKRVEEQGEEEDNPWNAECEGMCGI